MTSRLTIKEIVIEGDLTPGLVAAAIHLATSTGAQLTRLESGGDLPPARDHRDPPEPQPVPPPPEARHTPHPLDLTEDGASRVLALHEAGWSPYQIHVRGGDFERVGGFARPLTYQAARELIERRGLTPHGRRTRIDSIAPPPSDQSGSSTAMIEEREADQLEDHIVEADEMVPEPVVAAEVAASQVGDDSGTDEQEASDEARLAAALAVVAAEMGSSETAVRNGAEGDRGYGLVLNLLRMLGISWPGRRAELLKLKRERAWRAEGAIRLHERELLEQLFIRAENLLEGSA